MFSRILPPLDRSDEDAAGAPGGTLRLAGDVPVDLVGSRMERFSREARGASSPPASRGRRTLDRC
jgi:hypothetical protein